MTPQTRPYADCSGAGVLSPIREALPGITRARSLAGGGEMTGVRDYQPGDDFRYVDWYRCARHDELVSRRYEAALPLPTYLLVDGSDSMSMGEGNKFAFAKRLAIELRELIVSCGDPVHVVATSAAASDTAGSLESIAPRGGATDLAAQSESVTSAMVSPGVVVMISDLLDPNGLAKCYERLRKHGHQLFIFHLVDQADANPTFTGRIRLAGATSKVTVDSEIDADDLADYCRRFGSWLEQTVRYCVERNIGYLRTWTHESTTTIVERLLNR
ncbi:MAG: DUF58 domain-containing protein [Planctomycetales bacterium]|nr:DUF58 domain-containing protein [Planctomycetales bacterium]